MDVFQGPILRLDERHSAAGGGRGVRARVDLQPGTLLLREQAVLPMPPCQEAKENLHLILARHALRSPNLPTLLHTVSSLHPQSLDCLPESVRRAATEQHQSDVEALLTQQVGVIPPFPLFRPKRPNQTSLPVAWGMQEQQPPQRIKLSADKLLRLLLVLRFNAHYSGERKLRKEPSSAVNQPCRMKKEE